jgi:hypothetical protein
MKRGLAVVLFLFAISLPLYAGQPCCSITAVDSRTGLVTGKENATGRTFQFQAGNAALLKLLRPGTQVYANFTAKQVSLDGRNSCCQIVSVSAGAATTATPLAPRTDVPATAAASIAAKPAVQAAETLQATAAAVKTPAATALKATPAAPSAVGVVPPVNLGGVNLGGGTGFQRCCTLTAIQGVLGSTPDWPAKENDLGWTFGFQPLQHFPNQPKGFGPGSPLWVNFGTNQVSCDGVTVCGSIAYAQPVKFVQPTYLDVLPIGVIYVPPGDPQDPVNSSIVAKQIFSLTNMKATVTSTVNVTTTPGPEFGTGIAIAIAGPGVPTTNPQTSSTSQTVSESNMVGEAAQGPGGYPGSNDLVWFYVNPTYDVTYIGVWLYNNGQYPVVASPGQIVSIVPHPKQLPGECGPQWQFAHATIGELQAYAAGDTSNADAGFLNLISKCSGQPAQATGGGLKSAIAAPLTPAQKLIALDPMAVQASRLLPVLGQSPATTTMDPSSVLGNTGRFQPLALSTDDPGSAYPVTYCGTDAPFNFADLASQTNTASTSIVAQFQGYPTLILNPVAIAVTGINAAAGIKLPVPGSAVSLGSSWTITSTYTTATTKGTAWNVTGTFGSGMYGTKGYPSCDSAPAFSTTLYYDWVNHTVLFWSVPVPTNGTEVEGAISSTGSRVVFTSASGGDPLVVWPNAKGQFHAKLAPGSYRYYLSQPGGHTTALSLTIPANQSAPLQLPAMEKETAVLAGHE